MYRGNVCMELQINGQTLQVDADPALPLRWVLRDLLDMTGTKVGRGVAACGACNVRVDGRRCALVSRQPLAVRQTHPDH